MGLRAPRFSRALGGKYGPMVDIYIYTFASTHSAEYKPKSVLLSITMPNILITGSARGLGLEMVKRFAAQGDFVIATSRKSGPGIEEVVAQSNGRVVFIPLEVTDEASVSQSVKETQSILGQSSLDILVNCAGVMSASDGKVAEMYVYAVAKYGNGANEYIGITWNGICL